MCLKTDQTTADCSSIGYRFIIVDVKIDQTSLRDGWAGMQAMTKEGLPDGVVVISPMRLGSHKPYYANWTPGTQEQYIIV